MTEVIPGNLDGVGVASQIDWARESRVLALGIEDYLESPFTKPEPDFSNFNFEGWSEWAIDQYGRKSNSGGGDEEMELYGLREQIKAIFKYSISQDSLDKGIKDILEGLLLKASSSADTFGFVGAALDEEVIERFSPNILSSIFANALGNIKKMSDIQIGYLYGSADDGLISQEGLWDFDEFKGYVFSLDLKAKKALIRETIERIKDTEDPYYRNDLRFSNDFMPSVDLNRFLSRILLTELQKGGKNANSLVDSITSESLARGISLQRFWENSLYELEDDVPRMIKTAYESYLRSLLSPGLKRENQLSKHELLQLFKYAIVEEGQFLPDNSKTLFLTLLFEKFDKPEVIQEIFKNDDRYSRFMAKQNSGTDPSS